ncbi:MAG: 23S rRNA (guanosine(2251)-2'-O)-methyltransferase RlmB [Coxiellaceae bacterium]|jgi:23S rRNA (guanosine2251-2'-O)-methyltransferase|nr:23S rRNA (guanosine(2251)-2'-O)-methyltransferase RlmB [Coxiellaceae bacterium]
MIKIKHIFGYHTVVSALSIMPNEIRGIYLQSKQYNRKDREIIELAEKHHISIRYLSRKEIDTIVPLTSHQGVVAEVVYPGDYNEDHLKTILEQHKLDAFLLILDGLQDPHNLGACLRTANAAGVHAVIAPKDKACGLTPTVYKVASGAVGITPIIQVTNLVRTIQFLKKHNIWVYGATENAEQSIYKIELKPPLALVFGAEGQGLRRLTRENCDVLFKIPMQGTVANLNVSVAVGVGLFEVVHNNLDTL